MLSTEASRSEALANLQRWGVERVYISPGARSSDEQLTAWNSLLADAGIQSWLLLSENSWVLPCKADDLAELVAQRLVSFLEEREGGARFAGLHLDIEPHGLRNARDCDGEERSWTDAPVERKREWLRGLLAAVQALRDQLDAAGLAQLPIGLDLALWYDELREPKNDEQSFWWSGRGERRAWYRALDQAVAEVTIMAYCRAEPDRLKAAWVWEDRALQSEVRVGLSAAAVEPRLDSCPRPTWGSAEALFDAAERTERRDGRPVDFYSYSWLLAVEEAASPTPPAAR